MLRGEGSHTYAGEIVVRGDSTIVSLEDLGGRNMGYVDPYSTSGFIYPAALLAEAGVEVVPVFTGSHRAVIEALQTGQVDAAATFESTATGNPALRVIQRTADIPNEPVFFRATLAEPLRERFEEALTAVEAAGPGQAIFSQLGGISGFAPVTDSDYSAVHVVIARAARNLADVVPDGGRIYDENRQPLLEPVP